jgi:hypothetical protein
MREYLWFGIACAIAIAAILLMFGAFSSAFWLGIACVIAAAAVLTLYKFGKIQKSNIIEWLLYAVTEAEKQLGGGTGELKLRIVYDWFIAKYPTVSKFVSFGVFSYWVDAALDKMRAMLENARISDYVKGGVADANP